MEIEAPGHCATERSINCFAFPWCRAKSRNADRCLWPKAPGATWLASSLAIGSFIHDRMDVLSITSSDC